MGIASYGGLTIGDGNDRIYPGAGGSVGGWTPTDANYGWLAGAGVKYNQFTPGNVYPIDGDPGPGDCRDCYPMPSPSPDPGPGPLPGPDPTPTPAPTPTPTPRPGDETGGGSDTSIIPAPVQNLLNNILSTVGLRRSTTAEQPLFLYTPAAPAAGNSGGPTVNISKLAVIAIVGAVAVWAYKKYA